MGAPVKVLIVLGVVLVAGLSWFWFSTDLSGPGPLTVGPGRSEVAQPGPRGDASVAAIPEVVEDDGGRAGLVPRTTQPKRGETGAEVTMTVRAADGRPIREALGAWGLAQHELSCVGTRRSPGMHKYGSISAANTPFRFATMGPKLEDGDTTFTVVVTQRPRFLSVVFGGVVIATERVGEGESEILVKLTEDDVRGALGRVELCLPGGARGAVRARAYLRGDTANQLNSEADELGCLRFKNVAPGEYQLSIYANRFASYFQTVQVEPSQSLELGDITLQPPVPLSGSIQGEKRFAANRQIAIQVIDRSKAQLTAVELRRISTDGKGQFRVFDLPAGEYALRVVLPATIKSATNGHWPLSRPRLVDTRSGPQSGVVLELEDAHGVVVRNGFEQAVELDIRDNRGVSVARLSMPGKGVQHVALLSGSYLMVATSRGEEIDRRPLRTPPAMSAIVGG
ncbi:MAG: hypothetical protein ACI8QZ_004149 [Chlamydiales bacterium]|jgi:hypothetical protein